MPTPIIADQKLISRIKIDNLGTFDKNGNIVEGADLSNLKMPDKSWLISNDYIEN